MDADTGSENKFSWLVGWLTSPFQKDTCHIEQWFAVNFPDGQTATRDGSNLNSLPAAKQSEHWPLLRDFLESGNLIFFSQKFGLNRNLLARLQRLRRATLWDGETGRCRFCTARFCEREALHGARFLHGLSKRKILPKHIAVGKLDSTNRCYTLACWWNDHKSQGNWTWKPFTKLVSRLFAYSSKLAGVSSDGSRLDSLDFAAES